MIQTHIHKSQYEVFCGLGGQLSKRIEHLGKFDEDGEFPKMLVPAPEFGRWVEETIPAEDGPLHKPDHAHLIDAERAPRIFHSSRLVSSVGLARQISRS